MENASKALIIAGAILISIVLVSVGVIVVNSLNTDDAVGQMDQQAKDTFNSSFVNSSGDAVRGTVVKTLLSSVISSNASYDNEATKTITVTSSLATETASGSHEANDISALRNKINTSHRYSVVITYAEGLVHGITITESNSNSNSNN